MSKLEFESPRFSSLPISREASHELLRMCLGSNGTLVKVVGGLIVGKTTSVMVALKELSETKPEETGFHEHVLQVGLDSSVPASPVDQLCEALAPGGSRDGWKGVRDWFVQQRKQGHRYTIHVLVDRKCSIEVLRGAAERLGPLTDKGVNVILDCRDGLTHVEVGTVGGRLRTLFVPSMTREEVLEVTKRAAADGNHIAKKKLVDRGDGTLDFTEAAVEELQQRGTCGLDVKYWLTDRPPVVSCVSLSSEAVVLLPPLVEHFLAADAAAKARGDIVRVEDARLRIRDHFGVDVVTASRMAKRLRSPPFPCNVENTLVVNDSDDSIMFTSVAQARNAVHKLENMRKRRSSTEEARCR